MKKPILIFLLFAQISMLAQISKDSFIVNYINSGATPIFSFFGEDKVYLDEETLKINNYIGSPLLFDSWAEAEVTFSDGKKIYIPKLNYDALSDQLIVYSKKLNNKIPLVSLDKNSVDKVLFKTDEGNKLFYRLPALTFNDTKPKMDFFEVFASSPGKVYLIKSYYKKISHNRLSDMPYSDSQQAYVIRTYAQYYLKNKDGIFIPLKLKKKAVFRALADSDHEKDLKTFIKKNKLNLSDPFDVQKLLEYYHKKLKAQ